MTSKKHGKAETPPKTQREPARADASTEAPAPAEAGPAAAQGLEALQAERDDLLARLQRVSADYLNYQKRMQRDMEAARQFANEELIKSLLGVLDDMERALAAAREAGRDEEDPFLAGMQLVHDKAIETLGRFGLTVIGAEGRPFNPELHSAMMQQPSEDHPPQTVLREMVRGYRLKGRTIRPSGVIVSVAPAVGPDEAGPDGQADGEPPDGSGPGAEAAERRQT
jgi:molecular chaperone GrpE